MARNASQVEFKNFIKGLIDVASPLNFPDNASFDEQNFELNRDGTRQRRLGFDIENGGSYLTLETTSYLSNELPALYKWKDAAGQADKDFLVIQDGSKVKFFDLSESVLSTDGFVSDLLLSSFPENRVFSFATVDGRLVVACGEPEVAIVSFDDPGFSVEYARIKVRDLWGVEESSEYENDVSYRGPYEPNHYYNLQNQSWGIPRRNRHVQYIDPATYYFQQFSKYPSNSEVIWTALQFQAVGSGNEPFERIFPNMWEDKLGANIKAAKGYFIIDAVDRGSSRIQGFERNHTKYPELTYSSISLNADKTPGGASFVKEFAGRVFYAGFQGKVIEPDGRSPNLSNYVFFSQLVKSKGDYTKCYQSGDPTSRENSDIVDTDGGFIRISGAEQIIALDVIGNALIVLATNGVWAVVGGSDYGFTATNYRVDKITSFGCISAKSVVSDGGKLFYWSDSGIYLITPSELGSMQAASITENTIQNLYDGIDNSIKEKSRGVYDPLSKKIRWLFKEGTLFSSTSNTYELILDVSIGSFYKFRIYNSNEYDYEVVQGFDTNKYENQAITENVFAVNDEVFSSADQVVVDSIIKISSNRNVRYLFLKREGSLTKYSFGWYNNLSFKDWNLVDANAYLVTGDTTAGSMASKKQTPYVFIAMLKTDTGIDGFNNPINTSSCKFSTQWDWTLSILSNRWSNPQQAYRLSSLLLRELSELGGNPGTRLVVTKNKSRGNGRSFAMRFETEAGKDCRLAGWNITVNGTTTP